MPSNHVILFWLFLLLPSVFLSIRVFSNQLALHIRWPKFWSFSLSISPSIEYSGLISFSIDWFDLLTVQRTLKSILQHCSSKVSILQCSALFIVQFSHPYMTTRKTIALTRQTFAGKTMSLIFNMLSRFVMDFPGGSDSRESAWNAEDPCSIPGLERFTWRRKWQPTPVFLLENPTDRVWQATV